MNVRKISTVLKRIALSDEKLWTKPEWETYKKQHPDTKIKPKFSKGKGNDSSNVDSKSKPKSNPKNNGNKKTYNKLDEDAKTQLKQIKENPSKWQKFKSGVKNVLTSPTFKTLVLHVGQAAATVAAVHFAMGNHDKAMAGINDLKSDVDNMSQTIDQHKDQIGTLGKMYDSSHETLDDLSNKMRTTRNLLVNFNGKGTDGMPWLNNVNKNDVSDYINFPDELKNNERFKNAPDDMDLSKDSL
jgi:hypothetical protein